MLNSCNKNFLLAFCLAAGLFSQQLSAQSPGDQRRTRVKGQVDKTVHARIPGSTHRAIRNAQETGRLAQDLPLERMQLVISSSPEQQAALEQLIREQQDPSSPRYQQWLTPQQFGEQFGPTQAEVDAVTGWLRDSGFTVDHVANSRRTVEFSGTVGSVEQAFHTELHQYSVNGETHIANATDIAIPAALASVVTGVVSLHDFRAHPQHHVLGTETTRRAEYNSASGNHTITPYDFATIYDVAPVWTKLKIDGTGQNIAVVSRSNISLADVNAFRSDYGMPPASVQVVLNGRNPGVLIASGDDVEATLDTEWSGGIAPGANVMLVVSASTRLSDGVDLSSQYIVDHNLAPVISYSYGTCEADNGTFNAYYNNLWQQAVSQGMSVFVSAGDNGSAGCDDPSLLTPAVAGFAVSGLASTPYNVAVGGTQFLEVGGDSQYWSATNTTGQVSSALGYIPEVPWNESAYINPLNALNGLWAGSGGVSSIYQTPSWQVAPGVPASDPGTTNQHHRYLPDVSFTAAAHDGYRVRVEGTTYLVSGTSASTPAFAGVMTLINQYTNTKNGNPNPRFYALAKSNPTIFHDVIVGNNAVPCVSGVAATNSACTGPPLAPTVGTMGGYSAGAGYDLATGLGSVDVYQLLTNWGAGTTGGGGTGGTGGTGSTGNTGPGVPPPAGVISLSGAHLATGGGWQTQIELINPTAAPATAHLRIYGDNGNALSIPLTSTDGTIKTTASGLDPQLGARSVLILQSAASATGPVLQGSAEVTSDGAISGFLIFRYTPTGQEVLVPLSSGAASSYSLAFDNTGGLSTGLALASSSSQAVTVGVSALDQNGRTLVNSSLTIPPLGHQSFVASAQFAELLNQKGTLQITPPAGAQISLLGIRATATGAFTGIPLLGGASTGSGVLADLASGGGWTTLIQLVNTSSISAQAHLKFYGDDASALSLPVSSTDIPLNQTAASVDAPLLPNGTVLLQSTGAAGSSLLSGWALFTADPGVTGFLIFRFNPTGGQVLVPMATGAPSNYLVAFDQTNGLATGISLSNSAIGTANITAYLRDQNGNVFDSTVLNLPSQGHKAFVLTDLFPTAAGKYGTIQFVPPAGQPLGVAGIRYTPAGAFTSIPVLTP